MPGFFQDWSAVRSKAATFALRVALATTVVGGAATYTTVAHKDVALSVDGRQIEAAGFAGTVGELLEHEGIDLGTHDVVAPAPRTKLTDGLRVAVRYGRPLTLTLDHQLRRVWVTAVDVEEALGQLDVRTDGAFVSASRSERIPLNGMELVVRTARQVTVRKDGLHRTVETATATVRNALKDAGVRVDRNDRVSVPLTAFPQDGQVIKVTRVKVVKRTKRVPLDYQTVQRYTSSMSEGSSKVLKSGDKGMKVVRYKVTVIDGEQKKKKKISSRWADNPNKRVVLVGTREPNRASRSSSSSSSGGIPSSGGLNWAALAECESGGDPTAVNPAGPYYGLYQFSLPTWQSVGGSGLPSQASTSEQTMRAQMLYDAAGPGQWPVCGSNL